MKQIQMLQHILHDEVHVATISLSKIRIMHENSSHTMLSLRLQ